MIKYTIENDELEITGKMEIGDKIHGLCCAGYDWECLEVLVSAWGACSNPDCQAGIMADGNNTYQGITNWDDESIALVLLGETQ